MITEKTVFETADGTQFSTLEDAEQHQLRIDIKAAMSEGAYYRDGFDESEALAALLRDFDVTRKGEAK